MSTKKEPGAGEVILPPKRQKADSVVLDVPGGRPKTHNLAAEVQDLSCLIL